MVQFQPGTQLAFKISMWLFCRTNSNFPWTVTEPNTNVQGLTTFSGANVRKVERLGTPSPLSSCHGSFWRLSRSFVGLPPIFLRGANGKKTKKTKKGAIDSLSSKNLGAPDEQPGKE